MFLELQGLICTIPNVTYNSWVSWEGVWEGKIILTRQLLAVR